MYKASTSIQKPRLVRYSWPKKSKMNSKRWYVPCLPTLFQGHLNFIFWHRATLQPCKTLHTSFGCACGLFDSLDCKQKWRLLVTLPQVRHPYPTESLCYHRLWAAPRMTEMDLQSLLLQSYSHLRPGDGGIIFYHILLLWPWPWPDNLHIRTWPGHSKDVPCTKINFLGQGFRKLSYCKRTDITEKAPQRVIAVVAVVVMGVDYGGRGTSPRIWSRRTLMQIVPLRFCHIGTKRSVLWHSKNANIYFRRGFAPDPAGGTHDALQTP